MKIKHLLIAVLVFCASEGWAQESAGGIEGQAVTRVGRAPIDGVKVTLTPGGLVRYTGEGGRFSFEGLPAGQYTVKFESYDFEDAEVNVRVAETVRDLTVPMISMVSIAGLDGLDVVDFDMDGGDDMQYSSSNLSASKDLFSNIGGYKFSEMRFDMRGLGNETVYLNGIELNDALNGYSPWSLWTGLNDATRGQESVAGVGILTYGVGGMNGSTNINARASQIRKGTRASVAGGTNSYLLRVMLTYASGMLDNGWSYAFSVSTRQGRHAWVDGVYYNTWGYFGSVEKRFKGGHNLALTLLGAPGQRGAQNASTDAAYRAVGSNYYNSNWGYQAGKMRNARIRNNHEPVAMLGYTYNDPDGKLIFNAAASYRFGRNGYSALDWYNNSDPRPDYYRNVPNWFTDQYENISPGQESGSYEQWQYPMYSQINWDYLIQQNRGNHQDPATDIIPDGINPATMRRSSYIIEERRTDQRDLNFKAQLDQQLSPRSKLVYGLNYRWNRTEYFKTVKDLLGGDYYIDLDNFADRDFPNTTQAHNDLARPNRALYEGDKWGYDYYANVREGKMWGVYNYAGPQVSAFAAFEAGFNNLWREGMVEKGLFPTYVNGMKQSIDKRSLGESDRLNFFTYKAKLGINYNISGAHQLTANAGYSQDAPYFQYAFVSPRTRNETTPGLTTSKTFAADIAYNMRYPWMRLRLSAYWMKLWDQSKVLNFYDDANKTFTNFAMSGMDQRHMGLEVAMQVPIAFGFSFNSAINWGEYIYTSNPLVSQTRDNSAATIMENAEVYYKNLYVESTPQWAFNLGLSYRSGNNWYAGLDFNLYDRMYLSMNPLYRTDTALAGMWGNTAAIKGMLSQEKFDFAWVMNANVGRMWYLHKGSLGFSVEAKNLLNKQDIRTGGYEYGRLRQNTVTQEYEKFDSKYFYLYGINFYVNVYYRF